MSDTAATIKIGGFNSEAAVSKDGTMDDSWKKDALCKEYDGALWFSDVQEDKEQAIAVCHACPVREECLQFAVQNNMESGIWAETLPVDRRNRRSVIDVLSRMERRLEKVSRRRETRQRVAATTRPGGQSGRWRPTCPSCNQATWVTSNGSTNTCLACKTSWPQEID